jgi:hypothetical protein
MSDLSAVRDQLRLLTRRHIDDPGRDLKPACLVLIDALATHVSRERGELPQTIAALLNGAMVAAMRGDVATVVEQVELAVTEATNPRPRKTNTQPHVRAPVRKQVKKSGSAQAVIAKPVADTVDRLLAKLRAKQAKH